MKKVLARECRWQQPDTIDQHRKQFSSMSPSNAVKCYPGREVSLKYSESNHCLAVRYDSLSCGCFFSDLLFIEPL
jgi:hypothetical protein